MNLILIPISRSKVRVSAKGGNTSNLLKHMRLKHKIHVIPCSVFDNLSTLPVPPRGPFEASQKNSTASTSASMPPIPTPSATATNSAAAVATPGQGEPMAVDTQGTEPNLPSLPQLPSLPVEGQVEPSASTKASTECKGLY